MNKLVFLIILSCFTSMNSSEAGTIYKWKDKDGHTHFTDNLANIPLEQDEYEKREIESPIIKEPIKEENPNGSLALGIKIWDDTCSQCHFIDTNPSFESRRKLSPSVLNPNQDVATLAKELKYNLELRSGDMNDIKLADNEISSVAKYILSVTSDTHEH